MNKFKLNDIIRFILPEEMREEFKKPLGKLLTKNPTKELIKQIEEQNPPLIIFVGDYCVLDALKHGLIPDIAVIDGKNLREEFKEISIDNAKVIKSKNPPATITANTWLKIKEIFESQKTIQITRKPKEPIVLLIEGEEDLLVLPIALEAPENSFIIYGQPYEGIVVIKVTADIKIKFSKLIGRMKVERNEDKDPREKE